MLSVAFGDSHTGIFSTSFFRDEIDKANIFMPGAFTIQSIGRVEHPHHIGLCHFLEERKKDQLKIYVSLGEIDIRVHYWEEVMLWISRGKTINEFINFKANSYVDKLFRLQAQHSGIRSICILLPHPSQTNVTPVHESFPAVGDNITRNILTWMFSLAVVERIKDLEFFNYASTFNYLVEDDFASIDGWSHDGLHLPPQFGVLVYRGFLDDFIYRSALREVNIQLVECQISPAEVVCQRFRNWMFWAGSGRSGVTIGARSYSLIDSKDLLSLCDTTEVGQLHLRVRRE